MSWSDIQNMQILNILVAMLNVSAEVVGNRAQEMSFGNNIMDFVTEIKPVISLNVMTIRLN